MKYPGNEMRRGTHRGAIRWLAAAFAGFSLILTASAQTFSDSFNNAAADSSVNGASGSGTGVFTPGRQAGTAVIKNVGPISYVGSGAASATVVSGQLRVPLGAYLSPNYDFFKSAPASFDLSLDFISTGTYASVKLGSGTAVFGNAGVDGIGIILSTASGQIFLQGANRTAYGFSYTPLAGGAPNHLDVMVGGIAGSASDTVIVKINGVLAGPGTAGLGAGTYRLGTGGGGTAMAQAYLTLSQDIANHPATFDNLVVAPMPLSGGIYRLFNENSALILSDPGSSLTGGVTLVQNPISAARQLWRATAVPGGCFTFTSLISGDVVDVLGQSTANGAAVIQAAAASPVIASQEWSLQPLLDGSYRIVNLNSGKGMEVSGSSTASGTAIDQNALAGTPNQAWKIETMTGNPAPVYSGGTWSDAQLGYYDMAVAANTASYRAMGGGLYIHPNGWNPTPAATLALIPGLFPAPPILEEGAGAPTGPFSGYHTYVQPYWSTLAAVTVDGLSALSPANLEATVASFAGVAPVVAPIMSPNDGTSLTTYPFSSSHWDVERAAALAGGGWVFDAPPYYYFAREEAYRVWMAAAMKWAEENNLATIVLIFANNDADFLTNTRNYVADLLSRGAVPTVWAFDGYYGNTTLPAPPHPMGNEFNVPDQNYTARLILQDGN